MMLTDDDFPPAVWAALERYADLNDADPADVIVQATRDFLESVGMTIE